jgi:hypothetical protein
MTSVIGTTAQDAIHVVPCDTSSSKHVTMDSSSSRSEVQDKRLVMGGASTMSVIGTVQEATTLLPCDDTQPSSQKNVTTAVESTSSPHLPVSSSEADTCAKLRFFL